MRANLQLPRLQLHSGAIATLAQELQFQSVSRPLLMSDAGVSRCGIVERVLGCAPAETVVFAQVTENPIFADCDSAAAIYAKNACDCIIAVGGGSVIDAAKLTAVIAGHGGRAADFAGHSEKITNKVAPLIIIPTTAGTGSECSPGAGVHPDSTSHAAAIGGPFIIPKSAICDPDLTQSLPPSLTAATGIDALTHCIEGYVATTFSPLIDVLALDGIRRIFTHLEQVVRDGSDREGRLQLMAAAFAGGVAIQKGLGPAHAIALACGDQGIHHGKLSAIGLLASLRALETKHPEKLGPIAEAMGLAAGETARAGLRNLMVRLGLPTSLTAAGYALVDMGVVADVCAGSHFNRTSPYQPNAEEYASMIASVLKDD